MKIYLTCYFPPSLVLGWLLYISLYMRQWKRNLNCNKKLKRAIHVICILFDDDCYSYICALSYNVHV